MQWTQGRFIVNHPEGTTLSEIYDREKASM